jgi:hypothetical protein
MKLRKVQVFKDDNWEDTEVQSLKKGDRFRMFEEDGTPVVWDVKTEFIASSNPTTVNGVWGICTK